MLPTKFQVNWLLGLGEEEKKYFQDGHQGGHHGFPISMVLAFFRSTSHPDASYQVWSQLAFRLRRKNWKINFKDGGHGGYLGFRIGTILATFDL